MRDYVYPFHIAANGVVGKGNIPTILRGRLELHAITGGPVFLFDGRKTAVEASNILGDVTAQHPDFKLAVSATGDAEMLLSSSGMSYVTLYATTETIGYLRLVEEPEDDPLKDLTKAMECLRREGIRLNYTTTGGPIPVDPGQPRLAPERGHLAS